MRTPSWKVLRLWKLVKSRLERGNRQELVVPMLVLLGAGLLWSFIKLAEDVVHHDEHHFDRAIILAMRNPADPSDPIGPKWVEEAMRDFTALGGIAVLVLLTAAVAVLLAIQDRWRTVALVLVSIGGGLGLGGLLKHLFGRPRPDLVPHGSYVYSSSFPSGHSMMAAVTYLTLAALLMRVYAQRRVKLYLLGVAVTLMLLVGVSRVYLGVHWPTDVLAGWTLGAAWSIICWLCARWLQRRGQVEQERVEPLNCLTPPHA